MKILLITSYFPPDHHIGCVRWARLAKYLTMAGHKIFVFSAENSSEVPQTMTIDFIPKMVQRIGYESVFWSPFLKSQDALGEIIKNNKGIEKKDNNNNKIYRALAQLWNMLPRSGKAKEIANILLTLLGFPHKSWPWANKVYKKALPVVINNGIEIIIATHPYAGCMKAAMLLSKKASIPWIADMRDGWSGDFIRGINEKPLLDKLIKKYELKLLSTAHRVVTISPELGRKIICDPNKIVYIPNSFDPDEFKYSKIETDKINVVYTGNIWTENSYRIFLDAINIISCENRLDNFHISYYGKSYSLLKNYADAIGLESSILINKGYVSHSEAVKAQCEADLLLAFGWDGKFSETVTTGKVLTYLGATRPIIAICNHATALGRLIKTTGAGIVLPKEKDIEMFLKTLINTRKKVMWELESKRNFQEIINYSTENTALLYERLICNSLKGK
ncbi:MAG: glycosyltransferase family 4 protein [Chlorobium sp.]|nr:MAG: glycosyltransferase family 4 protein [Chlorobium sp.]